MKSKDLLKVLVVGIIIVGAAAIVVYALLKRRTQKGTNEEETHPLRADETTSDEIPPKREAGVDNAKKSMAEDISSRHKEASEIMRESVDKIFKEEKVQDEEKPSENEKKLDEIMKDLDNI